MSSWFDSAGVDEIPPMFAGEVVEKLDLDPLTMAPGPGAAGAVIVAAIAPVGRLEGLDRLRASVHAAVSRLAASGVRRFWIYRALDDQAEQWIRHPDAAAAFMAEAGAGACPPLFVGRLVQAIDAGARSTKQAAEACGAGSVCGRRNHTIRTMIEAAAPDPPGSKPTASAAAGAAANPPAAAARRPVRPLQHLPASTPRVLS